MLALGKRTHFLYTCTSPSFWTSSQDGDFEFKGKHWERDGERGGWWGGWRENYLQTKAVFFLWVTLEATEYHFYYALFIRGESLRLAHIQWGWEVGVGEIRFYYLVGECQKICRHILKSLHLHYPSWPCHSLYIYFCDLITKHLPTLK